MKRYRALCVAVLPLTLLFIMGGCAKQKPKQEVNATCFEPAKEGVFTVYDRERPLAGAILRIQNAKGRELSRSTTGHDGKAILKSVRGGWEMIVEAPLFTRRHLILPPEPAVRGGEIAYIRTKPTNFEYIVDLPIDSRFGYHWRVLPGGGATLFKTERIISSQAKNRPFIEADMERLTLIVNDSPGQAILAYSLPPEEQYKNDREIAPGKKFRNNNIFRIMRWRALLFEPERIISTMTENQDCKAPVQKK